MNLIDAVKDAGVVGAGGAGFPTFIKLDTRADCFVVNAAECEPLIETDKYLCRSFSREIISGTLKAAGHLGAKRIAVVLKRKYDAEIRALRAAIAERQPDIELFEMDSFYPAGDEQTIVQQLCRVSVPERDIPANVGVVVNNVGTVLNIENAARGIAVTRKYLSVTGDVAKPLILDVPIGMSVLSCVEAASPRSAFATIIGGPMMGKVYSREALDSVSVTKTTGNILVLPKNHYLIRRAQVPIGRLSIQAKSVCIRCRMCTDLCPRFLLGHDVQPHLVMRNLWREGLIEDNREYLRAFGNAVNCCECRACELFSCPMELSPCAVNIHIKGMLKKRQLQPERNLSPTARSDVDMHKIPMARLTARLGLSPYYGREIAAVVSLDADTVRIPLRQHIGKPALPVKERGETIEEGELLAVADEGVSANVHASISGVIREISGVEAVIDRKAEIPR